jgi:hypothetical protein
VTSGGNTKQYANSWKSKSATKKKKKKKKKKEKKGCSTWYWALI